MLSKILKDPLFSFVIIAGLIFLLYSALSTGESALEENYIVITDEDIDRLITSYQRTWNEAPDTTALHRLINEEIKSSIYYNEGLRLNLDHNDEIIRRRLVQKYEFLMEDLIGGQDPSEKDLKVFYEDNKDLYKSLIEFSFHHYYFSPDQLEDPQEAANEYYKKVMQEGHKTSIDEANTFFIPSPLINKDVPTLWQEFGKNFGDTVGTINQLGWQKPIRSGYGWHVIYIDAINDAKPMPYETVKDKVKTDFKQLILKDYNDKMYQTLKSTYSIDYRLNRWKNLIQ